MKPICGIIGFVSTKPKENPAQFLIEGLKRLEYRGYDSWGIAYGEGPVIFKKAGKVSDAFSINHEPLTLNQPAFAKASAGLAHTRWATHGGVTDANAHPHVDCTGKVIVAHNGIIENWETLKNELRIKGHEFKSETDTEVVPHLVEEAMTRSKIASPASRDSHKPLAISQFVEAVRSAFNQLEGLNAIAVYFPQMGEIGRPRLTRDLASGSPEGPAIVAFRNGSPLVVGIGDGEFYLASDVPAFLPYTRKVCFLEDGEGVLIKIKNQRLKIKIVDAGTGTERIPRIEEIGWIAEEADKGEYPYFLIKEIKEQAQILLRLSEYPETEIEEVAKMIKKSKNLFLTACGTASHATQAAVYLFSALARRRFSFTVGSEFPYLEDLSPKSLLVAASQSGETMDTLEAVRLAKKRKSKTIALVNVPGSSLTRLAGKTLYLNCGPEKAVVSTKAYTAKLAIFLLLAMQLAGKLKAGRSLIKKSAQGIKELFDSGIEDKMRKLAQSLKDVEHIFTIGRGVNYPTALEAALKIKEASYIHAEGFAGGELKHGVIALIEKGTPCLVFVGNDEARSSILSNAQELKSRGGYIIGISPVPSESFDFWIKAPDVGPASPIVNIIPAQLLAYHLALARGLDPDKPRNLAKSVTVK